MSASVNQFDVLLVISVQLTNYIMMKSSLIQGLFDQGCTQIVEDVITNISTRGNAVDNFARCQKIHGNISNLVINHKNSLPNLRRLINTIVLHQIQMK